MPGLTRTRRSATGRATAAAPAPALSSSTVLVLTADTGRTAASHRCPGTTPLIS